MDKILELKGVHHSYLMSSGQRIRALQNIDLSLVPDEILVLLGPSGSGKSTCLRILAGLIQPTQGNVLLHGRPLDTTNPEVSIVFQNNALLPWLSVSANIALGVRSLGLSEADVAERIKKVIDLVGLEGFEEAYPRELSGGMKQRVGLARALAMERSVLCLDEAFSALDVLTAEGLRRELLKLWLSKKTKLQSIILVTHNVQEAVSLGSRILVLATNPGTFKLSIKNDLPYPRDEKSAAFKAVVDDIHDVLTETIIPDTPEWTPPTLIHSTIESIPAVQVNEAISLLELIAEQGGRVKGFDLASRLSCDYLHVLLMAKATELFDLVDTPRNDILLTDLGRRFIKGDINERKKMLNAQMRTLRIAQLFKDKIESANEKKLLWKDALPWMQELLPNEKNEEVLDTLIQWGRYSEIFGYNDDTGEIYLDQWI